MTIPGTVEKSTSTTGRSNNNNSKSPTKSIQIKSILFFKFILLTISLEPGITVKRKPNTSVPSTTIPTKKNKKSSTTSPNNKLVKSTASVTPVASFDLEATICPICDEACTCPKTTNTNMPIVKSPSSKKVSSDTAVISKKPVNKKKSSSSSSNSKKEKPKYVKKYEISSDDSEEYCEEDSDEENTTAASCTLAEDPALSFIRMIYSDEESLDEEEAYALYQATQLFSSSSDEAEEEYFEEYQSSEESCDDSEDSDNDNEFEYTVVEYVQPSKKQLKKSTEFVAYESGDESESEDETQEKGNLLLNAENVTEYDDDEDEDYDEDDENWLTYSVFDVDRDLALNHLSSTSNTTSSFTSLSSHGSGTPDTLLFSTSSTDKIPNIAPQVLAAISAAAKHMANQRSDSASSTSKYFSYITLRDPLKNNEEVNEEEFLFFEEPEPVDQDDCESDSVDCSSISDVISDEEILIDDDEEEEFESFSEDCSSNESVTEIILPSKKINKTPTIQPSLSTTTEYINRWNRVPIGAFRRSRRPSIPAFHHIHPSAALKTFSTDPSNFTGTAAATAGEDSFDESVTTTSMERAYSVITWDELDLDITGGSTQINSPNSNQGTIATCPLPKRSRSVISASSNSLVNNFEWLNNNWNWEI